MTPIQKSLPKDCETDQEVRCCPSCRDYAILKAVLRTMPKHGRKPENTGIGCSSRFPYHREAHDSHTIRGSYIWSMPSNKGELLRRYDKVIVPEMNTGQYKTVLRDQYLVDAKLLNKVSGQPFRIAEIEAAIEEAMS